MLITNDRGLPTELSVWEIAHRWHRVDSTQEPPPMKVLDTLRWICGAIDDEALVAVDYRVTPADPLNFQGSVWDKLPKFFQAEREGCFDRELLNAVFVLDENFLKFCEQQGKAPPAFWFGEGGSITPDDTKPLSHAQEDRIRCQTIAAILWKQNPSLTVAAIEKHEWIKHFGMYVSVKTAARLIDEALKSTGQKFKVVMVTLTYHRMEDWKPKHISAYVDHVRKYVKRKGGVMRGVWVAELQERGAVHYHLVFWLPKGVTLPLADKQGWWPHGMSNQIWARSGVGYIVKYASKTKTTAGYPKGCRISGAVGLNTLQKMERRFWRHPKYIRQRWPEYQSDVRRQKGGGFLARATGEWMPSLYAMMGFGNGVVVVLKRDVPEWEAFFSAQAALTLIALSPPEMTTHQV